ncbi:MAG: glycosyl transferase family 1, partial [Bacteroidales bacterium]|nr:glycosyl transferase family 1 [Bacteroidales bacterium]
GRPILCIGPEDGDSARILNETQTAITIDFNDKERMKYVILDLMKKHQENQLVTKNSTAIEQYSRRNLTKKYAELLNGLIQ